MHTHPADAPKETVKGLNCFLDRILTTVTRTVYPELDLDVHHNAHYDQAQLLDLLTHISLEGTFANSGAKTRRLREGDRSLVRNGRRSPVAKALGYQLRDLDPEDISAPKPPSWLPARRTSSGGFEQLERILLCR
jgi:hypothetical protein